MIFFRTIRYLKYILLSRHRVGHGIHSPFVFDLVSRVFRNKPDHDVLSAVKQVRNRMLSDKRKILVMDLGAGSESLKTNLRRISDIARYSPVSEKYGKLLSNLAIEFANPAIIEIGTSLGISTLYMAASCTDTKIYTIEGCPSIAGIAGQNFAVAGLKNIEIMKGSFDEVLPGFADAGIKPGLVFIDGNHRKEPTVEYFNRMVELSDENTVLVIDDINYSPEMGEAWEEIKENEKVSFTVDIFRMGIVFFREGMIRYDYIIRY